MRPPQVFALTPPEERIPRREAQRADSGGRDSAEAAVAREPGGGTPRRPEKMITQREG